MKQIEKTFRSYLIVIAYPKHETREQAKPETSPKIVKTADMTRGVAR